MLPCSLGTWQQVMAPGRVAGLRGVGLGVEPGTLVPGTFLCMEVVCAPLAPPPRGLLSQAVSGLSQTDASLSCSFLSSLLVE